MEYLTSADCAKKWNVSQKRVAIYCKEGRIEGAHDGKNVDDS